MARGINKVILVGNLGSDPETKYTQSGTTITTISLATTSVRKDRDGNAQEKTEWHRVKFFGKGAEVAGEYLKKGSQVYIEGRLEYGSYEKDGVTHYTTDIISNDFQMLGSREGGGNSRGRDDDHRSSRSSAPRQGSRPRREAAPPTRATDFGADFADDDIPF